jgi:hypothetical protein
LSAGALDITGCAAADAFVSAPQSPDSWEKASSRVLTHPVEAKEKGANGAHLIQR